MQSEPIARELLLVGGGHSHVIFLRMLGMKPIPGLKVTLVSPETSTPYSGMLPGLIAGHYQQDEAFIDLIPLCRFAGATFIKAAVSKLSTDNQTVDLTAGHPPLRYDAISIDIGSTPVVELASGADAVIPVKPITKFLGQWQMFLQRLDQGRINNIGFVGSGAGGVELSLAIAHFLKHHDRNIGIHLFTDRKTILAEFDSRVRVAFEKQFHEQGIMIHRDFRAVEFSDRELWSRDDRKVDLDEVFWVTQAGAQDWPAAAGLKTDEVGFIEVDDTLRSLNVRNVWAVGDCATMVNHSRPKAGVFAVRQGAPLFYNIRAYFLGKKLKDYRPQNKFLSLIATGPKHAVGSRGQFFISGNWVWRWKNWIDQKFMRRFSDLPTMSIKPSSDLTAEFDEQMQCGGCGSKVTSNILREVLEHLVGAEPLADDAALVTIGPGKQLVQSVDHLRAFVSDPYLQAKISVIHALSDVYACGGTPKSVQALLTLPFAKPAVTRSTLNQIMKGVLEQLAEENAELIGGHTSEGAELSIGFAVNGEAWPQRFWSKQGLRIGDAVILTKAIGTGTILAADMQHRAKGEWVSGALEMMLTSNRLAWQTLQSVDVSACTDVTGFGLAGHLLEMIRGTDLGLNLSMADVPILNGASQSLHYLGIRSTLHDSNRSVSGLEGYRQDAEILFDPQTSGGLLVGVASDQADQTIQQLKDAGCVRACVIAEVTGSGILAVS